jgi:hypothetical protein
MARSSVGREDTRAIAGRLKEFALRRYGSWEAFYSELEISRTTADSWRGGSPCVPDPPSLLLLSRKANLDLNWLLLGEGEMLRQKRPTTFDGEFLARIEADLRVTEGASSDEALAVWSKMAIALEEVWKLAVDGVRPTYREVLHGIQMHGEVQSILNPLIDAWHTTGVVPPGLAEQAADKTLAVVEEHLTEALTARLGRTDNGTVGKRQRRGDRASPRPARD